MNAVEQTCLILASEFMFPDSQYAPIRRKQFAVHQSGASLVAGKFLFPEQTITFRLRSVNWAAMPETAIHKDRKPKLYENEVRFADDFVISPPASNPMPPE